MNRLLIAAAAAALAVPAMAQVAQQAPAPMKMRSGPMADGVMTLAEVQSMVSQAFQRKDANHDGVLTQDEMARKGQWGAKGASGAPRAMPKMDANTMFDRLDANHDGVISRDEFAKGHEMRMERERRAEMKGAPGAMMAMRGMHRSMMGAHMFGMADTNKDGRVTLAEAQAAAAKHFAMVDANHDGRVTVEEMKAMHQKMGAMHHEG